MLTIAIAAASVAAALHVGFFWLESVRWNSPRVRALFGTSPETAVITRTLAFNQGFYNLFLAIIVAVGVAVTLWGSTTVGATLMFAGCGAMVAAGIVLAASSRRSLSAPLVQAGPPAIAVIALALHLL